MDPYLIDFPLKTMRSTAGSISQCIHISAYASQGQVSSYYSYVTERLFAVGCMIPVNFSVHTPDAITGAVGHDAFFCKES